MEDLCELGVAVRTRGRIGLLGVEIVDLEVSEEPVGDARGVDDRCPRFGQAVEQEVGEQERGEVVDLEGEFVAVDRGLAVGTEDASGIVREHVDAGVGGEQVCGEGANLLEVGEVGDAVRHSEFAGDARGAFGGPADHHDGVPSVDEAPRSRRADTVARARQHNGLRGHGRAP